MTTPSGARRALLVAFLTTAGPAFAQEAPPPATGVAPPPVATEAPASQGRRIYTPADFTRFAPRNALDMLGNVPGFSIDSGDTDRRGLGQATGNVLINGERYSGKSTDVLTELQRISAANVVRIEIVDAATLNISGLSGQVANIVTHAGALSGNYIWRPQVRRDRTPPRLLNGEVSLNGAIGGTQYTLSFRNNSYRNGNAGPELVTDALGNILDRRDEVLGVNGEEPRLSASIRRNFGNGSILNLNAAGGFEIQDLEETSHRSGPGLPDRERNLQERLRRYNYELGGDYELGLGGGRLKLIGLHRFTHTPFRQTLIEDYADATPRLGQRFTQTADEAETIARGEYRWRGGGGADWQISLEGALNRLDIDNGLFDLDAGGDFIPVPFPNSAATVQERRGEAAITYGRPLSPKLNLQISLAGEYSELTQEGAGGLSRTFFRPKGFVNLAWRPRPGFDISMRIERAVGQLDFSDFVASANVSGGTANAGNANLVPPQSWNAQLQATRNLGRWGTLTARLYGRLYSDIVDVIPIASGGQSPGNIDGNASVYGVQWTSTFNFDPLGIPGAKLDMNMTFQKTRLTDPLTGLHRAISENTTREIDISFRHDIPHTQWAWGVGVYQYRQSPAFRLDEVSHFVDTPGNLGFYVENKNVLGLTVRASVDNLLGTNESYRRTIYDGLRTNGVLLNEARDRFYGPIFSLTISGTI